ncbi:MAG TPA: regulatory protein RecX [Microbacteriaceae bacterium]|nr:regulatory protein RecX [Microbacteriaceae bacterium]
MTGATVTEEGHLAPVVYLHASARRAARQAGLVRAGQAGRSAPIGQAGPNDQASEKLPGGRTAPGTGDDAEAARLALQQLARHDASRRELADMLRRRGIGGQVAEQEVARLAAEGLADDGRLARNLVETRFARKGLGLAGMRRELGRRGIADDDIDAALAGLSDEDDRGRALEVARARATHLGQADRRSARRRLGAYLARRGYSGLVVESVVREVLSDSDRDDATFGGEGGGAGAPEPA